MIIPRAIPTQKTEMVCFMAHWAVIQLRVARPLTPAMIESYTTNTIRQTAKVKRVQYLSSTYAPYEPDGFQNTWQVNPFCPETPAAPAAVRSCTFRRVPFGQTMLEPETKADRRATP